MTAEEVDLKELKKNTIDFLSGMLDAENASFGPHSDHFLAGTKFPTDKNKIVLTLGDESYTIKKMIQEISKEGDNTEVLIKMINDHRIELKKKSDVPP